MCVDLIRIDRVRQFYPSCRLQDVLGIPPIGALISDWDYHEQPMYLADHDPVRDDERYHIGRILYFVRTGIPDPIEIDNVCSGNRIQPVPILLDGHHRLYAAILRRDETIPCRYGGRVDLLEWLTGASDRMPED